MIFGQNMYVNNKCDNFLQNKKIFNFDIVQNKKYFHVQNIKIHNYNRQNKKLCVYVPIKINSPVIPLSDVPKGSHQYDAVKNYKSAGIIPYTIHNNKVYFLLQININSNKRDSGWNDFGGKRNNQNETTASIAAREFNEETSCLFYLKDLENKIIIFPEHVGILPKDLFNNNFSPEHVGILPKDLFNNNFSSDDALSTKYYDLLKNNKNLEYSPDTIQILKSILAPAQYYYEKKIIDSEYLLYINTYKTYISYFVKVNYIPDTDIPDAEDIHISYDVRYMRKCKWFDYEEIMLLDGNSFHKRLQFTKIQKRIKNYYNKNMFI